MISCRGKPLSPELKKIVVTVKEYFDKNKLLPLKPSAERTAEVLGIGVATVKRIMADYHRDPALLNEPVKMKGRPGHSVDTSHQEAQFAPIFVQPTNEVIT